MKEFVAWALISHRFENQHEDSVNKLPKPYFPHLCAMNNKRVPENAWKVLGIQAYHVVRACYFSPGHYDRES